MKTRGVGQGKGTADHLLPKGYLFNKENLDFSLNVNTLYEWGLAGVSAWFLISLH